MYGRNLFDSSFWLEANKFSEIKKWDIPSIASLTL
jgi:hypothetical protein